MSVNYIKRLFISPNVVFLNLAGEMMLDCILSTHIGTDGLLLAK